MVTMLWRRAFANEVTTTSRRETPKYWSYAIEQSDLPAFLYSVLLVGSIIIFRLVGTSTVSCAAVEATSVRILRVHAEELKGLL